MEWVIGILLAASFASNVYTGIRLTKIEEQQVFIKNRLNGMAPRQRYIGHAITSHQSPGVDAKAKTNRRDTDDLPLSGRMQSTTTRKTSDESHASND